MGGGDPGGLRSARGSALPARGLSTQAGPTLFSVGHGDRTADSFLSMLESAGIERLVDVRTAPGSRKHPQFGQAALSEALRGRGIEYVWRKDLGGWRKPRPDSPNTALRSPGFRGYADYMQTDAFERALAWLIEAAEERPTAIMCAESLWWRCHRRMVADAVTVAGVRVVHVMSGGRSEPHRLHPAARIVRGHVVYDQAEPDQQQILP